MKRKKNVGGRPKAKPGKAKAEVIAVRVTKAERRLLDAAAKRDGVPRLSDWVRAVLLAAAQPVTINSAESEDAGIEPHGGTGRGLGM